jgi:hypothetical protein
MNKNKIAYWIFTALFAGFMIFSSYGGVKPETQTLQFLHDQLGYPVYFIQFISVAKILGSIAILLPWLKTSKEWAYAGLFFDLIGAIYSINSVAGKFETGSLFILLPIIIGSLSYYFWKKTTNVRHLSATGSIAQNPRSLLSHFQPMQLVPVLHT